MASKPAAVQPGAEDVSSFMMRKVAHQSRPQELASYKFRSRLLHFFCLWPAFAPPRSSLLAQDEARAF
eukprot:2822661-Amphidinium_carterae.1